MVNILLLFLIIEKIGLSGGGMVVWMRFVNILYVISRLKLNDIMISVLRFLGWCLNSVRRNSGRKSKFVKV